ncbi:unnamed protein product [Sphagnum jensenii]|uniref:type I protein arginine methyltransferase n=1 Tax=Sphagnum jensenii TaxID=128206 RepID=A0ABP0XNZ0_9BRYO
MAAAAAARRLSPSTGFYTDLAILPIGRTLVDNPTADMRPAFGSPIPVFAKVDADSNGTFVDFYHAIAVLNEVGNKLEHFQRCYLHHSQILKAGPTLQIWAVDGAEAEQGKMSSFAVDFKLEKVNSDFYSAIQEKKSKSLVKETADANGNKETTTTVSKFEEKIEQSSAKMYFHYYGQLLHQQNMMQDYVRTGTYYAAVIENQADFQGRVVVDVGAGSGILSLFAAQAGAKHVYAVEASDMAYYARKLIAGNQPYGQRITVIHGKVEEVELPEKADILISEPMGTLLVNERMLESYIIARDRFLVPKGKMFPSIGRIHMAPFSDEYLYSEIASKALFWHQQSYYGVNLKPVHDSAFQGYFSQPVVDAFDPRLLIAAPVIHTIDFTTAKEEDLFEIDVPLEFQSVVAARVHGLACWFDVLFDGSMAQRWLSTAPGAPTTHWYQLRCVLSQPLYVLAGQPITGRLHLVAHSSQSYTIHLTMSASMWGPGGVRGGVLQTSTAKLDLKEPYYRMSQSPAYAWTQQDQASQYREETIAQQQMQQQVDGMSIQQAGMSLQQAGIPQEVASQVPTQTLVQQQQLAVSSIAQVPQQVPQQLQQYYPQNYWAS